MNNRSISIIIAGVVTGLLSIFFAVSYTSLIFAGELAGFLPAVISYAVQGALIIGLVTALFSSFPGAIGSVQSTPAAMYAVLATAIVGRMAGLATPEAMFATVLAGLMLTAMVAGLGLWLLGAARLGNLASYIPYPVTAGFMTGVGLYLMVGAVQITTGAPVAWSHVRGLLDPATLMHWLPAVIFGALLFGLTRRFRHPFVLPIFLAALIIGFHLWMRFVNMPDSGAAWTLYGPSQGALWRIPNPALLPEVDWRVLAFQIGGIGSILVVSSLNMLMNVGSLDINLDDDIDFNRELKVTGGGNLLLGLAGSSVGYTSIALSSLARRMHADSRLTGVTLAITCALVLTRGGGLFHLIPLVAIGALLFFLGIDFLADWLFASWGRLSKNEFAIVLLIGATMQAFGALIGVGIGLMLAVALFVFTYSRIDMVRNASDGAHRHSNVERPVQAEQLLRQQGAQIYILELEGFIFFGSGNLLRQQVRERIENNALPPLRYLLLDFRRVSGIDASAAQMFVQLQKMAERSSFILALTGMSPAVANRIQTALSQATDSPLAVAFEDMDRGLEWCEDELLNAIDADPQSWRADDCWVQFRDYINAEVGRENRLDEFIEVRAFDANHIFIQHGVRPAGVFFVTAGEVSVLLPYEDGRTLRLRRAGAGAIFGEMSFYADAKASATVMTDAPSTVRLLSYAALERMEREAPALAAAIHKFVARVLSARLAEATAQLHQLQE